MALICGNFEIVSTLLEHGADVNAIDAHYCSVMKRAALSSIGKQVIPVLLERGAEKLRIYQDLYSDEVKEVLQNSYDLHRKKILQELSGERIPRDSSRWNYWS